MLTALSDDQLADVDAIEAAIELSNNPYGPEITRLLAKRGIDTRLIQIYEEVACAVVRLLAAGEISSTPYEFWLEQGGIPSASEFDGTLAAEYVIDRYQSSIGPLRIEAPELRNSAIVRTFSLLVDALVLLMLGLARLDVEGRVYRVEPVPTIYDHVRRRIIAQAIDMASRASHKAMTVNSMLGVPDSSDEPQRALNAEHIANLKADRITHSGELSLDRVMALNPRRRLPLHLAHPAPMQQLVQISCLVALAEVCSFTDGPVRLKKTKLSSMGLNLALVPEVIALTPTGSYESFMRNLKDSIEFSLNCWPDQVLTHLVERWRFDGKHLSELLQKDVGGWFEKDYVAQDLQEFAGEGGWAVHPVRNLELKAGDGERAGDIDVVLTRPTGETLFVQVKFLQRYWMPYWCNELMLVRPMRDRNTIKSSNLVKGLRQLASVYHRRDQDEVIQTVSATLGWPREETRRRLREGTYVLIHNAAPLDFAAHGEAVMYEWNTFRNLIRGGPRSINLVTREEKRDVLQSPLSDPLKLGLELLSLNPSLAGVRDRVSAALETARARGLMNVEGKAIELVLPIV